MKRPPHTHTHIFFLPFIFAYVNPHCLPRTAVYCYIRSELNCKVMDVKGGDSCPDTKVIMYERKDGQEDNQLWWEDRYGVIRSKLTGFALDTSGTLASVRCHLNISPCDVSCRQPMENLSVERTQIV